MKNLLLIILLLQLTSTLCSNNIVSIYNYSYTWFDCRENEWEPHRCITTWQVNHFGCKGLPSLLTLSTHINMHNKGIYDLTIACSKGIDGNPHNQVYMQSIIPIKSPYNGTIVINPHIDFAVDPRGMNRLCISLIECSVVVNISKHTKLEYRVRERLIEYFGFTFDINR